MADKKKNRKNVGCCVVTLLLMIYLWQNHRFTNGIPLSVYFKLISITIPFNPFLEVKETKWRPIVGGVTLGVSKVLIHKPKLVETPSSFLLIFMAPNQPTITIWPGNIL
jgi:hypothetical protein